MRRGRPTEGGRASLCGGWNWKALSTPHPSESKQMSRAGWACMNELMEEGGRMRDKEPGRQREGGREGEKPDPHQPSPLGVEGWCVQSGWGSLLSLLHARPRSGNKVGGPSWLCGSVGKVRLGCLSLSPPPTFCLHISGEGWGLPSS